MILEKEEKEDCQEEVKRDYQDCQVLQVCTSTCVLHMYNWKEPYIAQKTDFHTLVLFYAFRKEVLESRTKILSKARFTLSLSL